MGGAPASFSYAALVHAIFLASALSVSQAAQPLLEANTSQLVQNRQPVQVRIQGVQKPTAADVAALYLSGDPDLKNSVPLKYKWLTDAQGYLESGSADLSFLLLNQRQDLVFLLYQNISRHQGFFEADVIARSEVIQNTIPNQPFGAHLALTGNPSEMSIQWSTRDAGQPQVRWGTEAGHYTASSQGTSVTYTREDLCDAPATTTGWIDPGFTQNAVMTGLQPGTRYFYSYGDEGQDFGFSEESSFVTGPQIGPDAEIKVLANADMGHVEPDGSYEFEYDRNQRLVNAVGSDEELLSSIDNVLHGNGLEQGASLDVTIGMIRDSANATLAFFDGDLSYARGFGTQWDVLFDQAEPLSTLMPTMVVEGNHERDQPHTGDRFQNTGTDSGGECGVPTYLRYQMPAEFGRLWYSFDHGPVHFLQYSTEVDFSPGSPQHDFILQDLKTVNRSLTPWVIVNGHRPIYTPSLSSVGPGSDLIVARDLRDALEDLFFTYQVDLTLSGHVHLYSRTCPVLRKLCQEARPDGSARAPVHLVIGNGGQWLTYFVHPSMPPYFPSVAIEHGYLVYTINRTTLSAQMLSFADGTVLDDFQLHKPANWRANPAGQAAFLSSFNQTYEESWLENPGIDLGQLEGILSAAQAVLADNPHLLHPISNSTLPQNSNAADTVSNILENLQPFMGVIREPDFGRTASLSGYQQRILDDVLLPLLHRLESQGSTFRHSDSHASAPQLEASR